MHAQNSTLLGDCSVGSLVASSWAQTLLTDWSDALHWFIQDISFLDKPRYHPHTTGETMVVKNEIQCVQSCEKGCGVE
jgi:hypothetical protein